MLASIFPSESVWNVRYWNVPRTRQKEKKRGWWWNATGRKKEHLLRSYHLLHGYERTRVGRTRIPSQSQRNSCLLGITTGLACCLHCRKKTPIINHFVRDGTDSWVTEVLRSLQCPPPSRCCQSTLLPVTLSLSTWWSPATLLAAFSRLCSLGFKPNDPVKSKDSFRSACLSTGTCLWISKGQQHSRTPSHLARDREV